MTAFDGEAFIFRPGGERLSFAFRYRELAELQDRYGVEDYFDVVSKGIDKASIPELLELASLASGLPVEAFHAMEPMIPVHDLRDVLKRAWIHAWHGPDAPEPGEAAPGKMSPQSILDFLRRFAPASGPGSAGANSGA